MSRLVLLAVALSSGLVLAAPYGGSPGGGGCCAVIYIAFFVLVYRNGGADWLRAFGAALLPGAFGWFIWRDRELGTGSRWVALIFGSLQVLSLASSLVFYLLIQLGVLTHFFVPPQFRQDTVTKPVDLTNVPEDKALGLHPLSSIVTDPPGAEVSVNGQERGRTPLETALAAGQQNEVKVELADFFPATQSRSPNTREHLTIAFILKAAAKLTVTSQPSGARVLTGTTEVLEHTPGTASPLDLGPTDVLVLLDGYQAYRQTVPLTQGETVLEAPLTPGVKIAVTSEPDKAEVFVDGLWSGVTPTAVFVAPKGKHTIEVKKETWAPAKKVFASVSKPVTFEAKLVDSDRVRAQQALAKARARYDKVNQALEKVQFKVEHSANPPDSLERQRVTLDRDMEKAAGVLERAEAELKMIEDARGIHPPVERE